MTRYEYKVVPAPERGLKGKGVKGAEAKFAYALEDVMNRLGAEGWEYRRAETLPSEERQGLTSKTVVYRNVLVFRRQVGGEVEAFEPRLLTPPREILADGLTEPDTQEAETTPEERVEDDAADEERPEDETLDGRADDAPRA